MGIGNTTAATAILSVLNNIAVAEITGVELPAEHAEDSQSFLAELRGGASIRKPLIQRGRGRFAIRDGRWKLIFGKNGRELGEPDELYDLHLDARETNDVIAERPELVERLRRRAEEILGGG